jgi:formylglycine-generating enzyme required for sulfatase activity
MLTLHGPSLTVEAVAFSPDGKHLATASAATTAAVEGVGEGPVGPGVVKVWEVATGKELFSLEVGRGGAQAVAFSPDGKRLAGAGSGTYGPGFRGELKVWDTGTRQELLVARRDGVSFESMAFSADGERIVTAGQIYDGKTWKGEVRVWDARTGQESLVLGGLDGAPVGLASSARGNRVACACPDNTVKVWDADTDREIFALHGHTGMVTSVAFSPDGKRLVSGSEDRALKLWDAETGREILTLRGHAARVTCVVFSPDGGRLASLDEDEVVHVWDGRPMSSDPTGRAGQAEDEPSGAEPSGAPAAGPPAGSDGRETAPAAAGPAPLDCTGPEGVSPAEVKEAQAAWAKYLGRQVEEEVEVAPGVRMTFVLVPPGRFFMGSPWTEVGRGDETLHEVTLTEPFDLGKTEVTQAQYRALTGDNPSHFRGDDLPVESVRWGEARDYADLLTKKRGDQRVYRLPTEAEWEHACRGGRPSSQPFGVGDGKTLSSREANFNGNSPYAGAGTGPYLEATCRVGSYPANALGLSDMHGNVWEWCADWTGPYPAGSVTNPTGPGEGSRRVFRGGCWSYEGKGCRAAIRAWGELWARTNALGFRLARTVPVGGK